MQHFENKFAKRRKNGKVNEQLITLKESLGTKYLNAKCPYTELNALSVQLPAFLILILIDRAILLDSKSIYS